MRVGVVATVFVLFVVAASAMGSSAPTKAQCVKSWNEHASASQLGRVRAMRRALVVPEVRRRARLVNHPGKVVTLPASCLIIFYRGDDFRTRTLRTEGIFRSGVVRRWDDFQQRVGESPPGNASVRRDGTINLVS